MRKRSIVLSLSMMWMMSTASANFIPADTTTRPWRMNEKGFLKKFEGNDTVSFLVKRWFSNRRTFSTLTVIGAAGTTLSAVIVAAGSQGTNSGYAGLIIAAAAFLGFCSLVFAIGFFIPLLFHSKKRLYHVIVDYQKGKPLPKRYRKMHNTYNRKTKNRQQ
ncbi:MAG: hypothetical protein HOP10_03360 [Chitinophagaceae bacterium]|nr:hypothetical protein [Chitinophagaceae bacterium]